jgi:ABC-type dipeptide/oligopeptide/nickel transport system ATPase component
MFNFIKKLFSSKSVSEDVKSNVANTKNVNSKPITNFNNQISDFPAMVFTIVGKTGEGKTTLVHNILKYLNKPYKLVSCSDDLNDNADIIVLDNLTSKVAPSVLNMIVDKIRIQRHEKKIYIITHHLLSQIPTELIQLSTKIIFFNSSFNVSAFTSKVGNICSKQKIEKLHEIVLSLPQYHYVIVARNKISKVYENSVVKPILDSEFEEYQENNNNSNNTQNNSNVFQLFQDVPSDAELLEFAKQLEGLSNMQKIRFMLKKYPQLSNQKIAEVLQVSPAIVKSRKCYLKKHNLI